MPFSLILKLASKLTPFMVSLRKPYSAPTAQSFVGRALLRVQEGGLRSQAGAKAGPYRWERHCPPEQTRVNHEGKTHPLAGSLPAEGRRPIRNCEWTKGKSCTLAYNHPQLCQPKKSARVMYNELGLLAANLQAPVRKFGLFLTSYSRATALPDPRPPLWSVRAPGPPSRSFTSCQSSVRKARPRLHSFKKMNEIPTSSQSQG